MSRALIVGAGIGGLSAAIALARTGIRSQIVERARVVSAEGAGIQLGPNATRILAEWGVLDAVMEAAVQPEHIRIFDGLSGKQLATVPLGDMARERYGAPYLTVHRADLHKALMDHVRGLEQVTLRRHFEAEGITKIGEAVTLRASGGVEIQGDMLIGADGIWSRVREDIAPGAKLRPAGKTAWRSLLDIPALPARFREPFVGLWMSPQAHVVHYPVRGGKALNLIAVLSGCTQGQGWSTPGDAKEIARHFRGWPGEMRDLISCADSWRTWALADLRPLKSWSRGRITLLGDAAHPILPFLAQGGAMAIEDAAALATALEGRGRSIGEAFKAYETARIGRAAQVRAASRKMGRIYHMRGVSAAARNLVLRTRRPDSLLAQYDWLYGFRGDG